ncbi:hypothetical protein [Chitinophaga arvensicola]|uniref:Uncharacterized protein n=1 Tax=Chitinophaga arvensicola TaxID=29529 RepID=A0A1I0RF20_9BACT|nr:hypothetical protein [Chitinophaga arvensicola]SEW39464.1 hypothetical protein SAMN04488122_2751 [Chitinophaga arvensicola]
MGYIKEPKGVNFVVDPKPLTENDKKLISEVISHYKATGKKKRIAPAKRTGKHAGSKKLSR